MTTLDDIKIYMLNKLKSINNEIEPYNGFSDYNYYNCDGYCGRVLYERVVEFWNNFNSKEDFQYLVSGKWATDKLDLDGGRDYFLKDNKFIDIVFSYMYGNIGWKEYHLNAVIYNSTELFDELIERYNNISVIRDTKIDSIIS